ncbi:IclR family transcriptional regulator [Saccharothrix sp. ST-888]|uniref:IclR family transcriptional regulator n=1 Tax=Saccharothrix sp. ST-888 TaxID=1427391 RepID=UPI0005EC0CD0|nr:IclR family transcriptional regulator C-terminal domain-containing protein [Saccharothrix sp. ST-888]
MSARSRGDRTTLDQGGPSPFGALQRALRLLEAVDRHGGGVTPAVLARELSLPFTAVQELAEVLELEGYLTNQEGCWVLGGAFALLGQANRRQLLRTRLDRTLAELRDELGAAVYFGRYHDGELTVEAVASADYAPPVEEWVDFRASAHASALGKCLLSQLDHDARRDHLSRHPVARLTSRTVTDAEQLMHRLERQPATVPVLDIQEYAMGTVCAAVPVTAGSTVGCLATSLPVSDVHRLRAAAELLAERAAPLMIAMAV